MSSRATTFPQTAACKAIAKSAFGTTSFSFETIFPHKYGA
jgi:hypothetical protein